MSNLENYKKAFLSSFPIKEEQLEKLEYNQIDEWDSIGHMGLMSELEEKFKNISDLNLDTIKISNIYNSFQDFFNQYKKLSEKK